MNFEKVGGLKPDEESDLIRVIVDNAGEIGRISREKMEMMVTGIVPVLSSSDLVIELKVGDEMIRVLGWQVNGMMEKWPEEEGGGFF